MRTLIKTNRSFSNRLPGLWEYSALDGDVPSPVELFRLLQVGHSKMDPFLLPIVVGIRAVAEFHRYTLRVQQSKLDGWWFIFVDEVGLGVLGPNFEDLLDRFKVLAGNLFRARGETVGDIEIVRSEKPALHVFH